MDSLKTSSLSISRIFGVLMVVNVGLLVMVGWAEVVRNGADHEIYRIRENRYNSMLLALEARQNSSDLTKFARTFVATGGDEIYEKRYNEIINRSIGKLPRAEEPHRIYWELVLRDDKRPRPDGAVLSLLDAMREQGFTEEEFAKLAQSKANSNALVQLEVKAMNAVKGLFQDADGNYTVKGPPNRDLALSVLFSDDYQAEVAGIMKPLSEFFDLLDERTQHQVEDARARVDESDTVLKAILAALVFFLTVSAAAVVFRVLSPIKKLQAMMIALAQNDTSAEVPFANRSDEIGKMAQSVQVFKANLLKNRELEAKTEQERAKAESDRKTAMQDIADTFQKAVGSIVQKVASATNELQGSAGTLSGIAGETLQQSEAVAAASNEASSNVAAVAASSKQLETSVREISSQVSHSASMAAAAVGEASETQSRVAELSQAADTIGGILGLIEEIASRTNLLALNATIEAARAGESGKGFAVVAQEVKQLAEQTSKATTQIQSQVDAIQSSTGKTSDAITSIEQTITQMSQIASAIAAAVEEQGAATQEISRSIEQASNGTTGVSSRIESVNEAMSRSGEVVQTVHDSSSQLSELVRSLSKEAGSFVDRVRSA